MSCTLKAFSHAATAYVGPAGTDPHLNKYGGCLVTTATATASILIRNGASGTIVGSIPASSAAGYTQAPVEPVVCDRGVYFDLNGATGTVTVFVED